MKLKTNIIDQHKILTKTLDKSFYGKSIFDAPKLWDKFQLYP